jgi:hypothetical protein
MAGEPNAQIMAERLRLAVEIDDVAVRDVSSHGICLQSDFMKVKDETKSKVGWLGYELVRSTQL